MYWNTQRAEAPLLVVEISKVTSPQRLSFKFSLTKQTKHKLILQENIHATREYHPREN